MSGCWKGSEGQGVLWEARCQSLDCLQMNYDHLGRPQTSSRQACHERTDRIAWLVAEVAKANRDGIAFPSSLSGPLLCKEPCRELHRGFINESNESRLHTYNVGLLYLINLPQKCFEVDYYARAEYETISTKCGSRFSGHAGDVWVWRLNWATGGP
jgi:hypothetical protein